VTIRRAREADASAVASLCGELGYPIPAEQARTRIVDDGEVVLLVADTGAGEVVGWIEVAPRRSVEFGEVAEIQGLVVTASIRGRDVGSRLLTAAERWAREHGFDRIRVRSNVIRERTHGFYLARGYSERKRQVVFDKPLG
jgi:GNAT superfamily N-acetyltransferase